MAATGAPDYYNILQVSQAAELSEIAQAYRRLAKIQHPDKNRDDPTATEKFQHLQEAWETLRDPVTRRRYDASRPKPRPTPPKPSPKAAPKPTPPPPPPRDTERQENSHTSSSSRNFEEETPNPPPRHPPPPPQSRAPFSKRPTSKKKARTSKSTKQTPLEETFPKEEEQSKGLEEEEWPGYDYIGERNMMWRLQNQIEKELKPQMELLKTAMMNGGREIEEVLDRISTLRMAQEKHERDLLSRQKRFSLHLPQTARTKQNLAEQAERRKHQIAMLRNRVQEIMHQVSGMQRDLEGLEEEQKKLEAQIEPLRKRHEDANSRWMEIQVLNRLRGPSYDYRRGHYWT